MIDTAVLLAAGEGSRLRGAAASKPLCPVAGRALIDHALAGLARAGIRRVVLVLGYRGRDIAAHLARSRQPVLVETAWSDPRLPNGVSVLAAARAVGDRQALLEELRGERETRVREAEAAHAAELAGTASGEDAAADRGFVDPFKS